MGRPCAHAGCYVGPGEILVLVHPFWMGTSLLIIDPRQLQDTYTVVQNVRWADC